MYRFSTEDRDYIKCSAINNQNGEILGKDDFHPIKNKLFNFDLFRYNSEDKTVIIYNSVARTGSIASVLILEGNKTFGKHKDKFLYKCIPDDRRLPIFLVAYRIKLEFNKAYKNRYIIIYFKNWDNKHPIGNIDQNLGPVTELPSFYQYQLYCRSLNASIQNFTRSALAELKKHPENELVQLIINKYKVMNRRSSNVITIDPIGSRDFDDAIGLIKGADNIYILSIYIANVPLWLDFLGLWDSFSNRIATIYLPDRKLPMLPTILSDVLCSLQENSSRFALALDIHINEKCEIINYELNSTVIKVSNNLRYDTNMLSDNQLYKEITHIVKNMSKKKSYGDNIKSSHDVVAYLMILMNHKCADIMFKNNIGIYRSMTFKKNPELTNIKEASVKNFIRGWHSSGGNYSKIKKVLNHDALNLDKYIHITSPIRRLVDLLNIIELQSNIKLSKFTQAAIDFHNKWTTEDSMQFINETMKSIRKIQNECALLHMCFNNSEILSTKHKGFIFDKMQKSDGLYQYQVYLIELKMVRKTLSSTELDIYTYNNCELYLFTDQERMYKKVRITLST